MSELEKIFENNSEDVRSDFGQRYISFEAFKSALTEVFDKVRVTDQELLDSAVDLDEAVGAYKIRELQNSRIEKLLKP